MAVEPAPSREEVKDPADAKTVGAGGLPCITLLVARWDAVLPKGPSEATPGFSLYDWVLQPCYQPPAAGVPWNLNASILGSSPAPLEGPSALNTVGHEGQLQMVMMVVPCGLSFFRALMSRWLLLSRAWNELPVQRVHNILALVITCNISKTFSKSLPALCHNCFRNYIV